MPDPKYERRSRIASALYGRPLNRALALQQKPASKGVPSLWEDLEGEAADHAAGDSSALVTPEMLAQIRKLQTQEHAAGRELGLFNSTDDVIIIPGFMGSALEDTSGKFGLIWIDPRIALDASELSELRLNDFVLDGSESDADPSVKIQANGAVPLIYGLLQWDLEIRRYATTIFGFDWRKNLEESSNRLAAQIMARASQSFRPLHLIAHSQGTLVARRAIQKLGPGAARSLINTLVLLGPATYGTFSAAFAIAGTHETIEIVKKYGIHPPADFTQVLQSMSGVYQLLPWKVDTLKWLQDNKNPLGDKGFWQSGVDTERLGALFAWAEKVDTSFFNDRTAIVLGNQPTVGGVKFEAGKLVKDPTFMVEGDGTVPETCARLPGVRAYKAKGAEHMLLPATPEVLSAVRDLLAGRMPRVLPLPPSLALDGDQVPVLAPERKVEVPAIETGPRGKKKEARATKAGIPATPSPPAPKTAALSLQRPSIPLPVVRRLRVFSFDPLLGTKLDLLDIHQLTVSLPWNAEDGDGLRPGPIGEYIEVIDTDPASNRYYYPVHLNHEQILAQDGLPPSEGNPQFHQQMVYAVSMSTIRTFEKALGRVALWAPHLERDERGSITNTVEDQYVPRLRIYPHALRKANAYYSPEHIALLFGYFPAQGSDVGQNLPGGTVFTCLSFDIVAHETTHALLDGMHRYFATSSHQDVLAFHEAFADIVALFQHFSHSEVLRHQLARAQGDLNRSNILGELARQFGEATGKRGALRQYLGKKNEKGEWEPLEPDPKLLETETEPHTRGAILVAAAFRAFLNMYDNRVADLRRIASDGTGILRAGDLHPDLVNRLADEAAKAARHILQMCIRALDYTPPVDLTFGEYLRALITADYDLIRDDDLHYRVAVIDAFRAWGILPADVRSWSVESLVWQQPDFKEISNIQKLASALDLEAFKGPIGRRELFFKMAGNRALVHNWLNANNALFDGGRSLGLALGKNAPGSIRRDRNGNPVFEVHSVRTCQRVGPDGQQQNSVILEVVQRRKAFFDPDAQAELDRKPAGYDAAADDFMFRGGATVIIDPVTGRICYWIRKRINDDSRLEKERAFRLGVSDSPDRAIYFEPSGDKTFALLHGD